MYIGLAQLAINPDPACVSQNRTASDGAVRRLFDQGARLVLLPELANWSYFPSSRQFLENIAEPVPTGETIQHWLALARQYHGYIAGGILERSELGIHNSAVLVGPEGIVAVYRKIHLFDWETQWLAAGDKWVTARLDDEGVNVGLLICYDLRFPEALRQLALMGVDMVLVPTTWTGIDKPILWDAGGYCLQNHVVMGHAFCNRIAVVCADRVGVETGVTYLGASVAVNPSGVVAGGPLSGQDPALAVVEVDCLSARNKKIGAHNDLMADRRGELYRDLRELPGMRHQFMTKRVSKERNDDPGA